MARDQSELFWTAWKLFAPTYAEPVPEYKFASEVEYTDASGRTRKRGWRIDWAFIDYKLAIEVDGAPRMVKYGKNGRPYAVGGHDGDKDHLKENTAAALGWRVMHFSPAELRKDPVGCVELVRKALEVK